MAERADGALEQDPKSEDRLSEKSSFENKDLEQRFICDIGVTARIAALVEPVVVEMGFRLVRVKIMNGNTLQIMADRADGGMTIEDCTTISRRVSPLIDAHDPMSGRYFLEISTPGIDRPLVRPSDFIDWVGHEAKIELRELIDGRRRFRGIIDGFESGEARIRMEIEGYDEPQIIGLPVTMIGDAKLVLTDQLLKMAKAASAPVEAELNDDEEPASDNDKAGRQ
ncbi:MAG: ribosome maturation factor RimP [Alphaproteobacteria bacterium]